MEARRELIEAVGDRYRKSERADKKKILDEFVELSDETEVLSDVCPTYNLAA